MRAIIRSIGALAILGFVAGCTEPNRIVSNGERIGIVRKFSLKETDHVAFHAGAQSWEGEADVSVPGTHGGEVFLFSVEPTDARAVERVKQAMRERKPVAIIYRQWLRVPQTAPGTGCTGPRNLQGTPYTVYDVQPIDSPR